MVAIITDTIKRNFLQQVFDEAQGTKIGDSDNYYYIAIGRSQQWDPVASTDVATTPTVTEREERLFRYNAAAIKAIEAYSYVVPARDWTANSQYAQYNDNQAGQPAVSYYVRTNENNVYVCIRNGKDANGNVQVSTVKPTHLTTALPKETDGYIWKYMYTISTADTNFFVTSNYIPVKLIDSAAITDPGYNQWLVQNAADSGQIIGYRVVNGGSGYDSGTTSLTVDGDGSGAQCYPVIGGGAITAVEVGDSTQVVDVGQFFGTNYNKARVKITSSTGTSAEVVPIFGPKVGLGKNPIEDLRATAMMFQIKPEGQVNYNWIVDNDYRQIALWKNPLDSAGARYTANSGNCLRKVKFAHPPIPSSVTFSNDIELSGDSNAKAWIDFIADSAVWYHQDEQTGFTPFRVGEPCTIEGYGSTVTVSEHKIDADIDIHSGEIYFINNAIAQNRTNASADDIKLVIQL